MGENNQSPWAQTSLPPQGAWIEMVCGGNSGGNFGGVAPPHGERGLKSSSAGILNLPKEDLLALLTETV